MRQIQAALTLAVFAVLCVVAWELHQINHALQPSGALFSGVVNALQQPPETRAQRNDRLQRQQRELEDDAAAILATPAASRVKKGR